jgi:hypothetical protein
MWPIPEVGDIVWCRYPRLAKDLPGPKPRPALVLQVRGVDDVIEVTVAYGTSQHLDQMKSGEFAIRKIENGSAYALAGLSYDTKFDLNNTVCIPWDDMFFSVPLGAPYGENPKLGCLHPSMMKVVASAARAVQN